MNEIEKRREAAAKGAATLRARKSAERECARAMREDRENALRICREIRDNPNAADADRLKAIGLIAEITSK